MGDPSVSLPEGLLFGLGNPLLDITAAVDAEFLKKYHMNANDAILGGEHQKTLSQDMIDKYQKSVEYSAGGSCLNSSRIAQWHLPTPNVITNTGCIGDDEFGRILQEKAREAGVNVQLRVDEKEPTGSCAVLVTDKHRSLCAFLNAALSFKQDHLAQPQLQALIEKAQFYYSTGYFLVVSLPSLLQIAEHSLKTKKQFLWNISAGYVCEFYKDSVEQLLPYVDVVFGNDQEFSAFSDSFGLKTKDMHEVARLVHAMPKKSDRKRTVVITRGADPALVCDANGDVREYPAGRIPDADIADTNGAGDGFVGGFLSQYIQHHPIAQCMACGHYTAGEVIRQHGVKVPAKPNFVYEQK
ncbi:Adenosine kinase 2 [Hypsibius exemplaris]|uniref:Adenosine kinase n=1 Tax=Hypsibius exemplaris TaxID=2072580 RepID=A0A1W0WS68_HYPEX|nr:Adenosine kinase 2 [Hypsibius exemplaris]